jgi:hypothetical protein
MIEIMLTSMKTALVPWGKVVAFALLSVLPPCYGQGTFTWITFDGPPLQPPGTVYNTQQYYENSMSFTPLAGTVGFGRAGGGVAQLPDNGTAYLQAALGQSLTFGFINGSVFDLRSVDLAEYSTVVPNAVTVHLVGYRPNGSTVTTDLTTDGIIDGSGPLVDFQTFSFGPEFSGLTRVEIPTIGWSLDNLGIRVPEPGAGALVMVGGAVFALRFAKGRKHL